MKRFMICVLDHATNTLSSPAPIFSDSEENARLYAEELAREVAQETPVHIYEMTYVDSVKLGFSWQRNGNLFKLAKKNPEPSVSAVAKPKARRGPAPTRTARRWTDDEIKLLQKMIESGASGQDMANVLHRTVRAIHSRCHDLGIGPRINKKAPQ